MLDTIEMEELFGALENELRCLESATAQSLSELDAEAGVALCRWLEDWSLLDDLRSPT